MKVKVIGGHENYVHVWNEEFPFKPFEVEAKFHSEAIGAEGGFDIHLHDCAKHGGAASEILENPGMWNFTIYFKGDEVEVIE